MRKTIGKWIWIPVLGAGFVAAMPEWGRMPGYGDLLSAAKGLAEGKFGAAGMVDSLRGWLWGLGGVDALSMGQWLAAWAGWTLVLGALGWVAWAVVRWKPHQRALVLGMLGLVVAGICGFSLWERFTKPGLSTGQMRLILPVDLADFPAEWTFFANGSAHPVLFLLGKEPGLLPEEAWALAANPAQWREALRKHSWDAVLLAGPSTEIGDLLAHLLASPDWKLGRLANSGWLFERAGSSGDPAIPSPEDLDLGDKTTTAVYLAQLSSRFEAMKNVPSARSSIERALELAPDNPEVHIHAARFGMARGRWQDVVSHARSAIKANPASAQAKSLLAFAELESGNTEAAEAAARSALRLAPGDLQTRLLLARILRARKDHRQEAEVLEELVGISRSAGMPYAGYLAYLGQAHAELGNARKAAESYRQALDSGQLTPTQTEAVRETLALIESRASAELGGTPHE